MLVDKKKLLQASPATQAAKALVKIAQRHAERQPVESDIYELSSQTGFSPAVLQGYVTRKPMTPQAFHAAKGATLLPELHQQLKKAQQAKLPSQSKIMTLQDLIRYGETAKQLVEPSAALPAQHVAQLNTDAHKLLEITQVIKKAKQLSSAIILNHMTAAKIAQEKMQIGPQLEDAELYLRAMGQQKSLQKLGDTKAMLKSIETLRNDLGLAGQD